MSYERRNYPKVSLGGEASILLAGVIRSGKLMNLSPAGIEIECRHQLVEQLTRYKSDAGLYPDFELEFNLSPTERDGRTIKSTCNVSYCRRLRQDCYHLGLCFKVIDDSDEEVVTDYIFHTAAA